MYDYVKYYMFISFIYVSSELLGLQGPRKALLRKQGCRAVLSVAKSSRPLLKVPVVRALSGL